MKVETEGAGLGGALLKANSVLVAEINPECLIFWLSTCLLY